MSSIPTFKTCPECGTQTPGDPVFCVECGASLADVPPTTGLMRAEQTQFSLPDYLREEQYRRSLLRGFLADDTGTGSGLIWGLFSDILDAPFAL